MSASVPYREGVISERDYVDVSHARASRWPAGEAPYADFGPRAVGRLRWLAGRAAWTLAALLERLGWRLCCVRLDPRRSYVIRNRHTAAYMDGDASWSSAEGDA